MSAEESLAQAEAARKTQERKHQAEQPLTTRLNQIIAENNVAALFREALGSPGRQR